MTCKTPIDPKMNLSQGNMAYFYMPELLEINFTALLLERTKVRRLCGEYIFQEFGS